MIFFLFIHRLHRLREITHPAESLEKNKKNRVVDQSELVNLVVVMRSPTPVWWRVENNFHFLPTSPTLTEFPAETPLSGLHGGVFPWKPSHDLLPGTIKD
jgi:hypothetical protein